MGRDWKWGAIQNIVCQKKWGATHNWAEMWRGRSGAGMSVAEEDMGRLRPKVGKTVRSGDGGNMRSGQTWGATLNGARNWDAGRGPNKWGARWSLGARASARGNREQVGGKES